MPNTFNFVTLKNRPIRWRTLYIGYDVPVIYLRTKYFE